MDRRYPHPAVSLGWRHRSLAEGDGLRAAMTAAISRGGDPLLVTWSADPGAGQVTALVPARANPAWLVRLLRAAAEQGVGPPVSAVVGDEGAVASTTSALDAVAFTGARFTRSPVRSVLHRRTRDGVTRTTITGVDPALRFGGPAAALAVRVAGGGPNPLLPSIVDRSGLTATIRFVRGLQDGVSTVTWLVDAPERAGLLALEAVLDAGALGLRVEPDVLSAARASLLAELHGHRHSPVEFARALARYETLGWDGDLVHDPESALAGVTTAEVGDAISGLLKPVVDVLGRT
ncbi:hypothetical protein NS220_08310 [Microbacterium testaceum]|uniref:Uncharacterized protein n=1 Tax=Microbacterium testaceum TaxID=2033 RepID=A0A147EXU3_MICTE|nr:hypothetical protein NS220_08310 [Microbacterium testaceum]